MSKRDVNISEANLPLAPTIADFFAGLRKWHDRQQRREGQTHDPIHGAAFARDAKTEARLGGNGGVGCSAPSPSPKCARTLEPRTRTLTNGPSLGVNGYSPTLG